jgi:hypothetical protein
MVNVGGEASSVAAPTTGVVSAAPALAQALSAPPPASSTSIPPDPLRKRAKTVTEAGRASSRSAVLAERRVIDQFDGGNMSSSSCDTSLHENIPLTTLPALPPMPALPMTALPALVLPMMALPAPTPQMAAPPTLLPWSVHLPSYPPRVICRFCFKDSHEVKNCKCWDCWKKSD